MRVLIADDQAEVRSALRLLLEQEQELTVVAEAANAALLLAQAQRTSPDIVFLDWELPGLRPDEIMDYLRGLRTGLKVIAMSGRPEARRAAKAAGADGFISKGDPPERVLHTLGSVRASLRS